MPNCSSRRRCLIFWFESISLPLSGMITLSIQFGFGSKLATFLVIYGVFKILHHTAIGVSEFVISGRANRFCLKNVRSFSWFCHLRTRKLLVNIERNVERDIKQMEDERRSITFITVVVFWHCTRAIWSIVWPNLFPIVRILRKLKSGC